jgi:hypothetical protein
MNIMKSRLTFLLMVLTSGVCAQETPVAEPTVRNRIGLAIGIGHVRWTDKNSSPLTYQSIPKNVRLFYNLETEDIIVTVDLDVKMGGMKSKQHPNRTAFLQEEDYKGKKEDKKFPVGGSLLSGKLSLAGFYKTSNRESTQAGLGIRLQEEMFYPQGWVSTGLFNAISIGPSVFGRRTSDQHTFTATAHLPGISYVARLPYDNTVSAPNKTLMEGFFRNARWMGPGKFLPLTLAMNYQYQMNDHWGTGMLYELNTWRINHPQRMGAVSNALLVDLHGTF